MREIVKFGNPMVDGNEGTHEDYVSSGRLE